MARIRTCASVLITAAAVLASCGGGGGSSGGASPEQGGGDPSDLDPGMPMGEMHGSGNAGTAADDGSAASEYYSSGLNSRRLTGPVFGSATFANLELRKPLEFTASADGSGIELTDVWVWANAPDDGNPDVVAVLRNGSDRFQCGVGLDDITLFGADGTTYTVPTRFVEGSLDDSRPDPSDFCLAPSERAYVDVGFSLIDFAQVTRLEATIDGANPLATSERFSIGSLQPIAVSRQSDDPTSSMALITVMNGATETLSVERLYIVGLDEVDRPVFTDRCRVEDPVTLDPGADTAIPCRLGGPWQVSTLRVVVQEVRVVEP